ncbi:transglutaminase domain-containing protein [Alkalibacter rhizosphaerae]|uniref:Transglutaminase domain-containing protein n=1 Tax=Alkalibacter rhizosphaerae TaxID=2815577 RepID=A0A975AH19_9FIRM|nr:transglutaminase-like domain-containing protein [Alkalibacter rhizosphaerae]QSX08149.1 transglutaminase domain-containing protein [Alkalibacter rhizosphaerae]
MKKMIAIFAVIMIFGFGAGVFASDLFTMDKSNLINDELVPLGSSAGIYDRFDMEAETDKISASEERSGGLDLDESRVNQGVVAVKFDYNGENKIKISIKMGEQQVYYNYLEKGEYEAFPLVFGNGTYEIAVLENTTGNSYRVLQRWNTKVGLEDENLPYLHSVQPIQWERSDNGSRIALELTEGLKTDSEKFMAVYRYVVENLRYDEKKIQGLDHTYVPNNIETMTTKSGICYDYASLTASMLRSIGIPTKLVKGYGEFQPEVYHAWNEVLLDGQWILVDTSFDSQQLENGKTVDVVKNLEDYHPVSVY